MTDTAFFQVDTQLTSLLGETYHSSEAAIKELVDNPGMPTRITYG
jgi:hypothetical protein